MHPAGERPAAAPAPGPRHAPDPQVWSDPTRRRVLLALAEQAAPVTVTELARVVGGHVNTTRVHLEALREVGLAQRAASSGLGLGRPAWLHCPTDIGRSAALRARSGAQSGEYTQLAVAFVGQLAGRPDPRPTAHAVGEQWGASLAGTRRPRTNAGRRRLVRDALDRTGFTPVPEQGEFVLRTCPLLEAARRHPDVVCEVHRGLIAGLLSATGLQTSAADVELRPWGDPTGCPLALPDGPT
ncbi:MAG: helix-turn-helix domain-containing protein [Micrococcales bacterium]|nr:helix-turn-helix domain-containing protein [Micrococcales bacterium]